MSTQYTIQKRITNTDFIISKIKKARKLEIKDDKEGAILQIELKDGRIIYEIPLKNVVETDIICLRQYRKTDKLIQIIFTEGKQHLRIMRLNIQDNQIDSLIQKIHELRVKTKDTMQMLKICSRCGTKNSTESRYCNQCGCELQFSCLKQ
jgi:hypothetical protein